MAFGRAALKIFFLYFSFIKVNMRPVMRFWLAFSVLLAASQAAFANFSQIYPLDKLLEQSEPIMVKNCRAIEAQRETARKVYRCTAEFMDCISDLGGLNGASVLLGATFSTDGVAALRGVFLLDDSSAVFARKVCGGVRGGEFVLKRVLKADMGADEAELADSIRKKYMLNLENLTNFKGDMAKFAKDGTTALFFVRGEKSPHLFLLNNFPNEWSKELFSDLSKLYRLLSKDKTLYSGA